MKKIILLVLALMMVAGTAFGASWTGSVALQSPTDATGTSRPQGPYTFTLDITSGIVTINSPLAQLGGGITYPIMGTGTAGGIITIDSGQTGTTTSIIGNLTTALLDFTFDGTTGGTYTTGTTEYGMSMGIGYTWTVVPVPAGIWLLFAGLAGIVAIRRK